MRDPRLRRPRAAPILAPAITPRVEIGAAPDASGRAVRYGSLQYPRTPLGAMKIALTIDDGPDGKNHTTKSSTSSTSIV